MAGAPGKATSSMSSSPTTATTLRWRISLAHLSGSAACFAFAGESPPLRFSMDGSTKASCSTVADKAATLNG